MSVLAIQFAAAIVDSGDAAAAVAVDVIDAKRGRVPGVASVRLDEVKNVEVSPGTYLVRAWLPSGELISNQVEVPSAGRVDVYLEPELRSPREDLGWAYYLRSRTHGGVPLPRPKRQPRRRGAFSRLDQPPLPLPTIRLWRHLPPSGWIDITQFLPPVDLTSRGNDPHVLLGLSAPSFPSQQWLQVGVEGHATRFVAVPPGAALSPSPVRVLIVLDETAARPAERINVLVRAGNAQANALLGYLVQGAFDSARAVGEDVVKSAEELLQAKSGDPASAAIGGYYLLRAGHADRLDWTKNLDQGIDWFPDGAVIHAWHELQQSQPDLSLARARLIAAQRRGVPLYTQGLRLLFDGLSYLGRLDPEDTEVQSELDLLRPYAAAADWRAATTTFFGGDPQEPRPPQ